MSIWAVVLAGGIGSRFWPLSTRARPKQLLPLIGDNPLVSDTIERLRGVAAAERTLVLTNAALTAAIRETLSEIPADNVITEPSPAGTAAALAWAAAEIRRRGGENDVMVSVHADWAIGDAAAFREALKRAARLAEDRQALVTVGVVPTRDDPGLGYIVPGAVIEGEARRVDRFVEKPSPAMARDLCGRGALWNSGIFAWRVDVFLRELAEHTPEVASALSRYALERPQAAEFFAAVRPIAIDVALLERSANVLVVPGSFGWDDIGTWGALLRARTADASGNVLRGDAFAHDSRGNVVHAEGATVVLYGVHDLVVVARDDLVLVTTVEHSADLKRLMDALPPAIQEHE